MTHQNHYWGSRIVQLCKCNYHPVSLPLPLPLPNPLPLPPPPPRPLPRPRPLPPPNPPSLRDSLGGAPVAILTALSSSVAKNLFSMPTSLQNAAICGLLYSWGPCGTFS